jgi:hypothetical protein
LFYLFLFLWPSLKIYQKGKKVINRYKLNAEGRRVYDRIELMIKGHPFYRDSQAKIINMKSHEFDTLLEGVSTYERQLNKDDIHFEGHVLKRVGS